jgi:hypothetical protein
MVVVGTPAGGLTFSLDIRDAAEEPRRYFSARWMFFVGLALLLTPFAVERIREAFSR